MTFREAFVDLLLRSLWLRRQTKEEKERERQEAEAATKRSRELWECFRKEAPKSVIWRMRLWGALSYTIMFVSFLGAIGFSIYSARYIGIYGTLPPIALRPQVFALVFAAVALLLAISVIRYGQPYLKWLKQRRIANAKRPTTEP